jgi:GT2 family glycosyltransferase
MTNYSVIIPFKDKPELLRRQFELLTKLLESNVELILIDNQSAKNPELDLLLSVLTGQGAKLFEFPRAFNFSRIVNLGVAQASRDAIVLLNNDCFPDGPEAIEALLEHLSVESSLLVGATLRTEVGSISHSGINLGGWRLAHHIKSVGISPASEWCCEQAVEAVTFAFVAFSKARFRLIGGMDIDFPRGFGDVELCVRNAKLGGRNIVCQKATAVHIESASRRRGIFHWLFWAILERLVFVSKHVFGRGG